MTCSYTCTPDGVRELTTVTGTTDRWAEALIEGSYGRLSMLPDPVVLPTLYLPQTVPAGANAFSYSEGLVQSHLQDYGYDLFRDFHTVIVSQLLCRLGCVCPMCMCVQHTPYPMTVPGSTAVIVVLHHLLTAGSCIEQPGWLIDHWPCALPFLVGRCFPHYPASSTMALLGPGLMRVAHP